MIQQKVECLCAPNIEPQLTSDQAPFILNQLKFENGIPRQLFVQGSPIINYLLCNKVCKTIQNCASISVIQEFDYTIKGNIFSLPAALRMYKRTIFNSFIGVSYQMHIRNASVGQNG